MSNKNSASDKKKADAGNQPFFIGQEIELTIDRLSFGGGRGVGRFADWVVFVPATAPNELIRAKISSIKKNHLEANLIEILKPSPTRRIAPCPVVSRCGGCPWQHIEYSEQVTQKKSILEHSLKPLRQFGDFQIKPFIPAQQEFRYRNRIQLHQLESQLGYFEAGTHSLVDIDDCLIAEEQLSQIIKEIKNLPQQHPTQQMTRIELATLQDGSVRKIQGTRPPDLHLFSQVNTAQNQALIDCLLESAGNLPNKPILDLYCGSGNLTFPLAEKFKQNEVYGVELSRSAIELGKELRDQKNLSTRIHFYAKDVFLFLKSDLTFTPSLVVLDPPRPGCDQNVINELVRLKTTKLLYVSCNPMTFVRDAQKLLKSGLYRLDSIQGLDLFPQTEHLELIGAFSYI